jgi:hypothetical protein
MGLGCVEETMLRLGVAEKKDFKTFFVQNFKISLFLISSKQ